MHSPTIVHVSQRGRRLELVYSLWADASLTSPSGRSARRMAHDARHFADSAPADSSPALAPDAQAFAAREAAADADSAAACNTPSAADTTRARQNAAARATAADSAAADSADTADSAASDSPRRLHRILQYRLRLHRLRCLRGWGCLRLIAVTSSGTWCVFHANPPWQVQRRKAGESARRFLQSCRLSG